MAVRIKQGLDEWLDQVDYQELNEGNFLPSDFALTFMNFIKLVNGEAGESNKTPPVHLKMLDKLAEPSSYIANLCFRGAAKTTLFMEYLVLFIAMFGWLPGLGKIEAMIYVSDSMENGVKSARKNIEFRYHNSPWLKEWIPHAVFTDNYLEFRNKEGHRLGCKMFGAKTGLRGTKIFGQRPVLAVLDDLVSDDDARSKTAMDAIKATVYKGVNHALDPTRRKVVFNGTPFNKQDILIEAVESGAWDVNVWPVCERFPCEREEFRGAWEDRFSFDYVNEQYELAVLNGKVDGFMQELMLRITSEEERLVQDGDIRWYSRAQLLQNSSAFNFYITTDYATSEKQRADYSVTSVWAYNNNGDHFWVDGYCERLTMDKNIDRLFKYVSEYHPLSVGIEVNGQQKGFIKWIQAEMLNRNIFFNLGSSEKSGEPGIRADSDKLRRFNLVVPWFKMGKMYFPEEMKSSEVMGHCMSQIKLATVNGLKGKDDFLDTISQLAMMVLWKPSEQAKIIDTTSDPMWDLHQEADISPMASYIV